MVLRASDAELLVSGRKYKNPDRRPIPADEIEPLRKGGATQWGPLVGEACIYIDWSKTDWLTQDCVRPRARADEGSDNADT